jgi:hypothetical protein
MERIDMMNLTSEQVSTGMVALSSGHLKCSGRMFANQKMYKVNSDGGLELVFSPPRRLMRVELADFGINDVGQITTSAAKKRAMTTVPLEFAETDVSGQIQSPYSSYRILGKDVSEFGVAALEIEPLNGVDNQQPSDTANGSSPDEGGGFPWWAIVIIVLGALVFVAGVVLVAFRWNQQRAGANADAASAEAPSQSAELGEVEMTGTNHDRTSTVSSNATAANYQSLQEVKQYADMHLKDDDVPDTDLDETVSVSTGGTVSATVGQYAKTDMIVPPPHYDKITLDAFKKK